MTLLLLAFALLLTSSAAIENLMGTEIQKCVNCLCHARSGCYSRFNCARYSISFDYWKQAGSPTVDPDDDPQSQESYEKCKKNENCIVNTVNEYTESFGKMDCNCDGTFDCKDRFAIHLFGSECRKPKYGKMYANRFNDCAKEISVPQMLSKEGDENCEPETF